MRFIVGNGGAKIIIFQGGFSVSFRHTGFYGHCNELLTIKERATFGDTAVIKTFFHRVRNSGLTRSNQQGMCIFCITKHHAVEVVDQAFRPTGSTYLIHHQIR
ncbi:Uncharacterised protein [Klebsiella pneumoniae]|nr:Uncharacterised protein [Klebsiella pneumoniae]SYT08240.1 Uncharacterised protein [Klebsiella pneumoniae]VGC16946.1 Uncharacterised protein [Klebsiella pneumoniae]